MKFRTILLYVIIIAAVVGGGLYAASRYFFAGLTQDTAFADAVDNAVDRLGVNENTNFTDANIVNIAIFGIDSQDSEKGRSDATMILSIDYEHNKIKLSSIARDTLVYIPDKDVTEKFTHAYAYGGAELAVKTLNTNFNTNITNYVAVNFSEMASIVDLVGGVQVNLTESEREQLPNHETLSTGDGVSLDGQQAVAYSRIRYIDSDDMRTSRQREVLTCLFEKMRSMSATQYPQLIRACLDMCTTSMSYTDILSHSNILLKQDLTLEQFALPGDTCDAWGGILPSSGAWCYVYDLRDASDQLLTFIYEDIYKNSGYTLPAATVDKSILS